MRVLLNALALTIVLTTLSFAGCSNQQDRTEAMAAAERIHSFVRKQDFAPIYRESSEGFKQDGDESRLVESMKAIYQSVGALEEAKPIAYQNTIDSKAGRPHVVIYDLQFERGRGKERIVFTRTENGEMRLWDIVIEPVS